MASAKEPWLILESPNLGSRGNPSPEQMREVLRDLFDPAQEDEEHGAAWLRRGLDDGPMHVLEFTCGKIARFEAWADQDFEVEIHPTREGKVKGEEEALALWLLLAAGEMDQLERWGWDV